MSHNLPPNVRAYPYANISFSQWKDPAESTLTSYQKATALGQSQGVHAPAVGLGYKRIIRPITSEGEQESDEDEDEDDDTDTDEEGANAEDPMKSPLSVPEQLKQYLLSPEPGEVMAQETKADFVVVAADHVDVGDPETSLAKPDSPREDGEQPEAAQVKKEQAGLPAGVTKDRDSGEVNSQRSTEEERPGIIEEPVSDPGLPQTPDFQPPDIDPRKAEPQPEPEPEPLVEILIDEDGVDKDDVILIDLSSADVVANQQPEPAVSELKKNIKFATDTKEPKAGSPKAKRKTLSKKSSKSDKKIKKKPDTAAVIKDHKVPPVAAEMKALGSAAAANIVHAAVVDPPPPVPNPPEAADTIKDVSEAPPDEDRTDTADEAVPVDANPDLTEDTVAADVVLTTGIDCPPSLPDLTEAADIVDNIPDAAIAVENVDGPDTVVLAEDDAVPDTSLGDKTKAVADATESEGELGSENNLSESKIVKVEIVVEDSEDEPESVGNLQEDTKPSDAASEIVIPNSQDTAVLAFDQALLVEEDDHIETYEAEASHEALRMNNDLTEAEGMPQNAHDSPQRAEKRDSTIAPGTNARDMKVFTSSAETGTLNELDLREEIAVIKQLLAEEDSPEILDAEKPESQPPGAFLGPSLHCESDVEHTGNASSNVVSSEDLEWSTDAAPGVTTEDETVLDSSEEPTEARTEEPNAVANKLVHAGASQEYNAEKAVEASLEASKELDYPSNLAIEHKAQEVNGSGETVASRSMPEESLLQSMPDVIVVSNSADQKITVPETRAEEDQYENKGEQENLEPVKQAKDVEVVEEAVATSEEDLKHEEAVASDSEAGDDLIAEDLPPIAEESLPLAIGSTKPDARRRRSSHQRKDSHGAEGWTRPSRHKRDNEPSKKGKKNVQEKEINSDDKKRERRRHRTTLRTEDSIRPGSTKAFVLDDQRTERPRSSHRVEKGSERIQSSKTSHGRDIVDHDHNDGQNHGHGTRRRGHRDSDAARDSGDNDSHRSHHSLHSLRSHRTHRSSRSNDSGQAEDQRSRGRDRGQRSDRRRSTEVGQSSGSFFGLLKRAFTG